MKKSIIVLAIFLYLLLFKTMGFSQNKQIFINNNIQLLEISDSVYVHITWSELEQYGRVASNGILFIKNGKALLIDSPMETNTTEELYNYLLDTMHVKIEMQIPGHFHNDCLGGLAFLQTKGVKSLSGNLTREKCIELNLAIPDASFDDSTLYEFYSENVACYYLGGGHSYDNIVVYFPKHRILFGGCMVKSKESKSIGFIGDADMEAWPKTLQKLKNKFPVADIIVPGHGNWGGTELIDHTLEILQQNASKNN
jgi:metallo-beta-lactamase class B